MSKNKLLIIILILAAGLRLFSLSQGDTVSDEVLYGFRAIGLMDFDEAETQTTPMEWLDPDIPSWTKLSFHDHPPLVFYIQYIFIKIFGENNFALRFPSALLGIASVYTLYLIGKLLYTQKIGLIAAALLGTALNHVYISRIGLQESYVIFFLLFVSYLFLKSLRNDKYLVGAGIALGFAFLTKYTTFVLAPIFLTYLLIFRRDYFLKKTFWIGAFLAIMIFSPVIIYNLKLYQSTGHFDFQLSYVLKQNPDVWKIAPGKEIGGLADRIQNFIPRLIATHSWLFIALILFALIAFCFSLLKKPREILRENAFLLLAIFYLLLLLLLIGPSYRFLAMPTAFLSLGAAVFLDKIYAKLSYKNAAGVYLSVFLIWEIFYSVNNQILYYPIGPTPWLSSKVRYENYNWGYNELGNFLKEKLRGKMPALTFDLRYQFLEKLREKALGQGLQKGLEPYPALIIYAGNFDKAAKLWTLDRLHIYHAWPIISLETYFNDLKENGADYFEKVGFKDYYFILQTNIVPSEEIMSLSRDAPISIYNKRNDEVFKIYKF